MKMKSPTGSKTAGFNGREYTAGRDGIFDIDLTDVDVAKFHGFKPAESEPTAAAGGGDDPNEAPSIDPATMTRNEMFAFLKAAGVAVSIPITNTQLREMVIEAGKSTNEADELGRLMKLDAEK